VESVSTGERIATDFEIRRTSGLTRPLGESTETFVPQTMAPMP
jgi:hypothetical protein